MLDIEADRLSHQRYPQPFGSGKFEPALSSVERGVRDEGREAVVRML
jgi:hypothetical protein